MKKVGLSFAVIAAFLFYSWHQHTEVTNAPKITSTLSKNNTALSPVVTQLPATNSSTYKDGTYTGNVADAFYGNIQVQVTITSGKITNINFLQYPNDRETSIAINQQSNPLLAQEAIQAQSAHVDTITGATDSSQAFVQSMQSALDAAQ